MSFYLAGLAIIRCFEHERAEDFDPTARLTLAAMATFAGSDSAPECYAARSSIAARAGLGLTAVREALLRLEKLGAIEHGERKGKTVRWKLTLLVGASRPQEEQGVSRPQEQGVSRPQSSRVRRPPGRKDVGRSVADAPSGSPGGSPRSHAPSNEQHAAALLSEVMERTGKTAEQAQQWMDRAEAASKSPIRNRAAFIRRCLANYASTSGGAPARSAGGASPRRITIK